MNRSEFTELLAECLSSRQNPYHPLLWLNGEPNIGRNVYIGGFSEINAKGSTVVIGDNCDIASFVSINVADSHSRVLGLQPEISRQPITLENNVFVGSHCLIKGGAYIGHHSVIAAGTVVDGVSIPPYSLVSGNPMKVKPGYYRDKVMQACCCSSQGESSDDEALLDGPNPRSSEPE